MPSRISIADLIVRKKHVLTIDLRSHQDYVQSHWPQAVNIAFADDRYAISEMNQVLKVCRRHQAASGLELCFLIVSNSYRDEMRFAPELIRANIPHVCVLRCSTNNGGSWRVIQQIAQAGHVTLVSDLRRPAVPTAAGQSGSSSSGTPTASGQT
eukprot:TRINITY_DN11329_c0_g1_i2.p1 TRINITY_DN11329_c0_g1~~TRINITY_DN11329_c0_g1_i2.p1  ORF type:complete len:154 (+),score=27.82 TRINITY_DN11329_c0_g1_i2:133-594(+)